MSSGSESWLWDVNKIIYGAKTIMQKITLILFLWQVLLLSQEHWMLKKFFFVFLLMDIQVFIGNFPNTNTYVWNKRTLNYNCNDIV